MGICSFFRLFNKNRTSVLLGAGAALELCKDNVDLIPTVANITKEIVENKPENIDLIERIFLRLCRNQRPVLNPYYSGNLCYSNIHFEILFHILEELASFDRSWKKIPDKGRIVQFAHLVKPNFKYNDRDINKCIRHIIGTIYEIIENYDCKFNDSSNGWYKSFWLKKKNKWDVFTLNYDTTIEQSLDSYEDGYQNVNGEQRFAEYSITKLLENKNKVSTINHLHGCVLYGRQSYSDINRDIYEYNSHDLYKYDDCKTAFKTWNNCMSLADTAMDGTDIVQGPIITGLNKTDKTTCLPYSIYRLNLDMCLLKNNSLLIVGYSFGDKYINMSIERLNQIHKKKRVVIIDYWDVSIDDNEDIEDNRSKLKCFIDNNDNRNNLIKFMCKMSRKGDYMELLNDMTPISKEKPMISKNKELMFCISGFKNTIEKYGDEVLNFLNFK